MKKKTSLRENNFLPITEKETKSILKQLPNSAPGPDAIDNRSLKNYTKLLLNHLAKIFNVIVDMGHISEEWKKANTILLLKPKEEKKIPSSYWPISLLSCLGKVLEKIIEQKLIKELDERRILQIHQAGLRSKRSTQYNRIRLERFAYDTVNKKQHAAAIFFDIKAAFDSMWHNISCMTSDCHYIC